jgi:transposase
MSTITTTTKGEQETRRRIAGRLLLKGRTLADVADTVGASLSSVKRWKKAVLAGGLEALATKSRSGRPPSLDAADKQRLVEILLAGPIQAGYYTDLWTCKRVAEVIRKEFGVEYHERYPWEILRSLGFTCQKPEQRAREQNEEAVRHWRRFTWPRLKRGHANIS